MQTSTPTAEIRQVCVELGGTRILSDIDLRIPQATTVAIIGASGSGKSTLLKLLNGLRQPSAGEVLRDGRPIAAHDLRALRFSTGYALQEIGLFPHLSVRDNIALPMRLAGWQPDRIDARTDELIALMQLAPKAIDRFPTQMSGGQQQRAGLCRALALNPDLLLLDEAFSGLDAITRRQTHDHFVGMRGEQINSCLLVTHDLDEAARLADWLVILHRGRVVRQGPRDEVLDDPRDDYAARLIEAFR
ncbi:MAG: ATP-binding cassette domain-containing protein [Pseudomonadota bacterium]